MERSVVNVYIKRQECLFEGKWYLVRRIDYEFEVVYLKHSGRLHFCYIDDIREVDYYV